jgi:hypothetical protein
VSAPVPEEVPPASPLRLVRWSLGNSTVLAGLYLLLSAGVELARRLGHARWAERLSLGLENLPARTLQALGLLEPLRRSWIEGQLGDLEVRLAYGATSVAIIYLLGLVVGAAMWGLARLASRRGPS